MIQDEIRVNGALIAITSMVNLTEREVNEHNRMVMVARMDRTCAGGEDASIEVPNVCEYRIRFLGLSAKEGKAVEHCVTVEHDHRCHFTQLLANAYTALYNMLKES